MGITIFSPFGLMREEAGLLGLLTNYLRHNSYQISVLRCNGVFGACDRDGEHAWNREVTACFACMAEQCKLAKWAGVKYDDLSVHLDPEDVLETKRWISSLAVSELTSASWSGANVFNLCRGSIHYRFGMDLPDLRNKAQEQAVRRMMLSAARALAALEKYNQRFLPETALVSGGEDFLTAAYLSKARSQGIRVATLRWDIGSRSVQVHVENGAPHNCPLVFEDVTAMRPDCRTWPYEITQILEDLLAFLKITSHQLELPIAR